MARFATKNFSELSLGEVPRITLPRTPVNNVLPPLTDQYALGETGWLKAFRLEGYALRRPRGTLALQQALFPYVEVL